MKKFIVLATLIATIAISFIAVAPAQAYSGSGAGTIEDPFIITTCSEFKEINNALDASYEMTGYKDCTSEGNDIMIGSSESSFTGNFKGVDTSIEIDLDDDTSNVALFRYTNGASITGLEVTGTVLGEGNAAGIIGDASGGTYTNLISNVSVESTTGNFVGGIFGGIDNATVRYVTNNGNVTANGNNVGGVVGATEAVGFSYSANYGNVTNENNLAKATGGFVGDAFCSSTTFSSSMSQGSVIGFENTGGFAGITECEGAGSAFNEITVEGSVSGTTNVGGLIGLANVASINKVYVDADVTGIAYVGGIAGTTNGYSSDPGQYTTVNQAISRGNVLATGDPGSNVGGLIGKASYTKIFDSYSLNDSVSGNGYVGGLVAILNDVTVANSYAVNVLGGVTVVGGLVGTATGSNNFQNDFWDTVVSDTGSSAGGDGKTTTEMKNVDTYGNWDLESIWGLYGDVNSGYPCLRWHDEGCAVPVTDNDSDGIDDTIENAGPNEGDANNDEIPDSEESNVASFVSPLTSKYVTLEISPWCSLNEVDAKAENTYSVPDATYTYSQGLVNFTATCEGPGVDVTVRHLYFNAGSASGFIARKLTTYNNTYQTLDGAAVNNVTIGGQSAIELIFTMTEGGPLDNDQSENGVVVDPAGLGSLPTSQTPVTVPPTVIPAPGTLGANANSGALPTTGNNASVLWSIAFSLLLLGGAVFFVSKRRMVKYNS